MPHYCIVAPERYTPRGAWALRPLMLPQSGATARRSPLARDDCRSYAAGLCNSEQRQHSQQMATPRCGNLVVDAYQRVLSSLSQSDRILVVVAPALGLKGKEALEYKHGSVVHRYRLREPSEERNRSKADGRARLSVPITPVGLVGPWLLFKRLSPLWISITIEDAGKRSLNDERVYTAFRDQPCNVRHASSEAPQHRLRATLHAPQGDSARLRRPEAEVYGGQRSPRQRQIAKLPGYECSACHGRRL
jgi:hypothetical protein